MADLCSSAVLMESCPGRNCDGPSEAAALWVQTFHGRRPLVQFFEPLFIFEGIHALPEAVVLVRRPALALSIRRWNGSRTSSSPGWI